MIRIQSIEIEEFRGIRHLQIDLKGENFGICGPNGTGKSGVVDAIEFVLTGAVTRLSGAGSGDVSLKAHGPHVDSREKPQNSRVTAKAFSPSLKKEFTIERTVSNAANAVVTPDEPELRQIVEELAKHPEFALSRREIVKYIITPAGKRSTDVQTLLRLDQIGEARAALSSVAGKRKRDAVSADAEDSKARAEFLKHLGIPKFSKTELLKVVNEQRSILQAELLTDFKVDTSLKAGITAAEKKEGGTPTISRSMAEKVIEAFESECASLGKKESSKHRSTANGYLQQLKGDPAMLRSYRQQVLIDQGIALLGEDECPLCDTIWDVDALRKHLEKKREAATSVKKLIGKLGNAIDIIDEAYDDLVKSAQALLPLIKVAKPPVDIAALKLHVDTVKVRKQTLSIARNDPSGIDGAIQALSDDHWLVPDGTTEVIKKLRAFVAWLPEPSKEDEAREFLIVAQQLYVECRSRAANKELAEAESALAKKVSDTYGASSTAILDAIYDSVEADFTEFYRIINEEDEKQFIGELSSPSPAKLALNVDFYGRGKFPPGAYHSEGHQDGMGLCLYLALMKHTLGKDFSFAVLDDVLMSVDSGHRRAVCNLLSTKLPDTQFILTTHDSVWLEYMRTEKLLDKHLSFSGWTVENGPLVWSDGDVWEQIDALLLKNDVSGAAAKLRRYLEYLGTILASNFRASVKYQANGQYDFGDLVPAAFSAFNEQLKLAKDSAQKWGKSIAEIEQRRAEVKAKMAATKAEEWTINKAVHFNAWANMQAKEFEVVAQAFKSVLATMQCSQPKCGQFVRVSPRKGTEEILSCGCGMTSYNLKLK